MILEQVVTLANPMRKSTSCRQKRSLIETDKAKLSTQERAEEIRSSLDPEFPSFVKLMVRSHVTGCFWLGLPAQFCYSNLPKKDVVTFTLLDENGEEYTIKYLPEKCGLSGGWKGFSIAHKLVAGDALVFQLVKGTKFKVYIVRAYGSAEVDGALGLLKLDARAEGSDPGKVMKTTKKPAQKCVKFLPSVIFYGSEQNISPQLSGSDQPENPSEEVIDSEVLEGKKFSGSIVELQDNRNLESFTITVNGVIIDSEISEHVRTKYYQLCGSQKSSLHEHLVQGLNCKLVAGMISETANIADAIRASKLSTSRDEFAIWESSLKAFKQLGMNVDFLISRLKQLVYMAFESEQAVDSKRYREAVIGRTRTEEEIIALEMKLVELKDATKKLEKEIKTLKVNAEKYELKFEAEVNAPW